MTTALDLEYTLGYTFVILTLYWPVLEASPLRGTIGKRIAGIRVVALDGGRLGVVRAFVRHLARLVMLVGLPPLGYVSVLATPRRQAWDDLLSGSVTVRNDVAPEQVQSAGQPERGVNWIKLVVVHVVALAILYVPLQFLWDLDPGIELRRALDIYPADDPLVVGDGAKL